MKKSFLVVFVMLLSLAIYSQEKSAQTLPSVDLKTLDGKTFNTKDIVNDGKPIIISLWEFLMFMMSG
jgi:cytochrome c biogenesis protein CcmG, thiol:disulfide interchange protein DsbE